MNGTYYIYSHPAKGCRWGMVDKASTPEEAIEKSRKTVASINRPGVQAKAIDAMTGYMIRGSLFTKEEV